MLIINGQMLKSFKCCGFLYEYSGVPKSVTPLSDSLNLGYVGSLNLSDV